MTGWTGQAHLLADAIREPGFACAALNAAAWAAGVNPEATAGLIGAATVLTSGDCGSQLWAQADPFPDDRALLAAATELEGAVAELLNHASGTARACRADRDQAFLRFQQGCEQERAAQAALAAAVSPAARAEAQWALEQSRHLIVSARSEMADCDAALEILGDTGGRLAHAANCLRRVPDDLAATYETPYEFVHDGGKLPYDGDFLNGDGIVTIEAA